MTKAEARKIERLERLLEVERERVAEGNPLERLVRRIEQEERMSDGQLITKRRKDIAAWAVKNFKTWPKPYEITEANPEEIGCELVILNQHHLPVLRCRLGGGYVDSTTWFYAKRRTAPTPNAQVSRGETNHD